MTKTNDKSPIPKHHSRYGFPDETKPTKPVTRKIPSRLRLILLILALAASHGKVPESNPRSVERPSRSYWCLVGNGWKWRLLGWLLLVISSDYGSFPHSLLSNTKIGTIMEKTSTSCVVLQSWILLARHRSNEHVESAPKAQIGISHLTKIVTAQI